MFLYILEAIVIFTILAIGVVWAVLSPNKKVAMDTKPCEKCKDYINVSPGVFYCHECGRALNQ